MTVKYDESGDLERINCNGCDKIIGEQVIVKKGKRSAWAFRRTEDYLEAKIAVTKTNGIQGFHMTCGCRDCLNGHMTIEQLTEWVRKDLIETATLEAEKVSAVTIVKTGIGMP